MHIPNPQAPKPAHPVSPAEREDSMQERHRPAEVNTVLMIADVYSGNEIASWTEDQKNTAHCKTTRASQHGQVQCGRSGRQAALTTSPLDTEGSYNMRIVER